MARTTAHHTSADETPPTREELLARARQWESTLLDGPITYFPIRHHSPACATHLARWIEELRPDSIVIEGPKSLDRWTKSLVSNECVGPVAILKTYRESDAPTARRHSAFFPLCDYSPEWVAIRQGHAIGARVRFADMEFADKVRLQQRDLDDDELPKTMLGVLLADESNLRYSRFIDALVRRTGCRDFDELWDHLFESRADGMTTAAFVGTMATYCDLSRASHAPDFLRTDATLAREAVIVDVIRAEYKRLKKPKRKGAILVVTGGFHTVALPQGVAGKGNPNRAKLDDLAPSLTGSWLIRYSYDQLDALSGYRSGMPNPGFYDAIWRTDQAAMGRRTAVANLISTIARETRGQPIPHEASVTDSIAALEMLDQLAVLRGHNAPTRSDLLDAVASCMRKESMAGNDMLTSIVTRVLAGNRIGSVPRSAGQPPIIDDFRRLAADYRLPVDTIEPRGVALELYRKAAHRPVSFLLHQLQMLDVPYASFVDGPDFIHGHRLGKVREEWNAAWTPGTEARLAELASLGDTVAGAAAQRVMQLVDALEEEGAARSADAAGDLLIRTCRCGLHEYARPIIAVVQAHIAEDGSFASVASALSRLALLRSAREPLEATRLERLGDVIAQCFRRATHLIDSLATVPDDELDGSLDGLISIRELLSSQSLEEDGDAEPLALDADLFLESLQRLIQDSGKPARSEIAGAAAGLLHGGGAVDEHTVCEVAARYLDAAVEDVGKACGVVRGLMMTAREAFWRMDNLLRRIDELLQRWEDSRFNRALPHMRLAFSQLSPREIDSVAERVSDLHNVEEVGPLVHPDVTEEDMQCAVRATELMNRSLEEDGLQ